VSSDFDDLFIIVGKDIPSEAIAKALRNKIQEEEEEEYNPQDCAHCTMVGAHICEPCEGKWHS
jgi:metal-responsive CopG/Arc/MetJ family transcriptional regulator